MPESVTLKLVAPVGKHSDRPLLIYLPGMDGSGELFGLQSAGLRPYFDIRCLVIPGDDLSSWERLAFQTVQLIRRETGSAPVYLCGESFGACLALRVVALAPALADHLILINSASSFHRFPWLHWVANLTPWVAPPLYQTSTLGSLPVLANLSRISEANRQALVRAMEAVSQGSAAWRLALLSQFRLEPLQLQRVAAPTLLVASLGDRLLPSLEEAQRLAALLPNSRIYPLPHSGHASLLEDGVNLKAILAAVGFLPLAERDGQRQNSTNRQAPLAS
ncbi:alpha/beta fold hydrolase [Nodosilinea nodulosa]|uniref:alpha/beta fold hydrolase n=1 Tax=Nodosilinea nodulosa TaxID=416001 RepID=UPI00036EC1FC|nr:alpha/beta hydrolase [Nodosilinea nodulosa]